MSFAPQHDWTWYEDAVSSYERDRISGLTPTERFTIYEDYFETLRQAKVGLVDSEALERDRWGKKIAMRNKMIAIYKKLDGQRLGKIVSSNAN